MNIWRQVKTVLWSFVGIGGSKRGEENKISLLAVIAVAFVLVALFLGTLAFIAKSAVAAG
ncbi:MAG TPA: DUF2970 domain-containing protein [Ramlibacter sp.]|nr:DUF2970 domain-containing protein [Ramlibacter sp.]